jgi:hypothetical protein
MILAPNIRKCGKNPEIREKGELHTTHINTGVRQIKVIQEMRDNNRKRGKDERKNS